MEPNEMAGERTEGHGWIWIIAFMAFGTFNIADWIYGGRTEFYRLFSGLGFLLMSPHAYLNPVSFTKLLSSQLKRKVPNKPAVQRLAFLGFAFLVAGVVGQWL